MVLGSKATLSLVHHLRMQAGETAVAEMDTNVVAVAGITRVCSFYQTSSPNIYDCTRV